MIKFSILIPTLNRPIDLERALRSVFKQTYLPNEIIIVDQSSNDETRKLVENLASIASNFKVRMNYYHLNTPGLTMARNIALDLATGEYATFLDDDVILETDYLAEISKTIIRQGAIVVQGKITNYETRFNPIIYGISRMFLLSSPSRTSGYVYRSFGNTLPVRFTEEVPCAWASGCNHTIRLDVARELRYDQKLISYAIGEDVDLTFRVAQCYPGGVWASSNARLVHLESPQQRIGNRKYIYMETVHRWYLFKKNIKQVPTNKIKFLWSRVGLLVVSLLRFVQRAGQFKNNTWNLIYLIKAHIFAYEHRKEIAAGDLEFFHDWFARNR